MDRKKRYRLHHVKCAECGKEGLVEIDELGHILTKGWYYFGKINVNECQTSKYVYEVPEGFTLDTKKWKRVRNPCYNPKVKRKFVEYWECEECFNKG